MSDALDRLCDIKMEEYKMGNNTMVCDYCGEEHRYVPIIEKPKRYGYKGKINFLPQINNDGRFVDNVCLTCLSEEIQVLTDND